MKNTHQPHEMVKKVANSLAKYGRKGDSVVAHINPREAELLKARGGSGTVNPHTGLLEFFEGDGSNDNGGGNFAGGESGTVGGGDTGVGGGGSAGNGPNGDTANSGGADGIIDRGQLTPPPAYNWTAPWHAPTPISAPAPAAPAAPVVHAPTAAPAAAPVADTGQGYAGSYHFLGPAGAAGMDPLGDPMTRGGGGSPTPTGAQDVPAPAGSPPGVSGVHISAPDVPLNNLQSAANPADTSGTVGGAPSGTANALQSAASPTSPTPIGQASNLGAANPAANPTGTTGASGTSAAGSPTSPATGGQPGGNDLLSMFLANQNTQGMYG